MPRAKNARERERRARQIMARRYDPALLQTKTGRVLAQSSGAVHSLFSITCTVQRAGGAACPFFGTDSDLHGVQSVITCLRSMVATIEPVSDVWERRMQTFLRDAGPMWTFSMWKSDLPTDFESYFPKVQMDMVYDGLMMKRGDSLYHTLFHESGDIVIPTRVCTGLLQMLRVRHLLRALARDNPDAYRHVDLTDMDLATAMKAMRRPVEETGKKVAFPFLCRDCCVGVATAIAMGFTEKDLRGVGVDVDLSWCCLSVAYGDRPTDVHASTLGLNRLHHLLRSLTFEDAKRLLAVTLFDHPECIICFNVVHAGQVCLNRRCCKLVCDVCLAMKHKSVQTGLPGWEASPYWQRCERLGKQRLADVALVDHVVNPARARVLRCPLCTCAGFLLSHNDAGGMPAMWALHGGDVARVRRIEHVGDGELSWREIAIVDAESSGSDGWPLTLNVRGTQTLTVEAVMDLQLVGNDACEEAACIRAATADAFAQRTEYGGAPWTVAPVMAYPGAVFTPVAAVVEELLASARELADGACCAERGALLEEIVGRLRDAQKARTAGDFVRIRNECGRLEEAAAAVECGCKRAGVTPPS